MSNFKKLVIEPLRKTNPVTVLVLKAFAFDVSKQRPVCEGLIISNQQITK